MWDASCKVGLVMLKAVLKANQSALYPPHASDWSFQYKTKVSLWVWFFQNQYGQRYQYFWFLTHPSVKKGDTVMCMPNVHSHAQLTNWQWFSMVCTLIDNDIHYHRGQNLLQTHPARWISRNFWAMWWWTSLYRDHAKPLSIPFLPQ